MSGSLVDRLLAVIELLADQLAGLQLQAIAAGIGVPKSAAHRLLGDLQRSRYAVGPGDESLSPDDALRIARLALSERRETCISD